jgi:ACS family tartrate transporter-like MFS transporter
MVAAPGAAGTLQNSHLANRQNDEEISRMEPKLMLEKRVIAKVTRRLVPFLMLLYFFAFLDRVNVGFAALTMNKAIGLTAYTFGWGAGIFFIGYFLFEVPSNIILDKVGARVWIARIMITWGLISAGTALVTGSVSFMLVRFFLGVAEAGFFPGVILYLTYWFPARYRGRVIALFFAANPISTALGSPISGLILGLDGLLGLAGWQWLFVIEGIPSVLLGFVTLRYLTDRPGEADWLSSEERDWLVSELTQERAEREARYKYNLWQALTNGYVLILGFVYFALVTANNGLVLWQPQIIKTLGLTNLQVGFVNAIPFIIGVIAMIVWGRHADQHREYRMHFALACAVACAGLVLAASTGNSVWAIVGLSVAALGGYGALPTFWPLPTAFLSGTAAAGGIALVNSIGNLGGFAGPYILGWLRDTTKGFTAGLYFLAASALAAGIVAALTRGPVGRSASAAKASTASGASG